jgi:hypothetical protein
MLSRVGIQCRHVWIMWSTAIYLGEMPIGPLKYTSRDRIGHPHDVSATAPQLGMIVHSDGMRVATYCHELGHTFGTCGSREVRNIILIIAGWPPSIHKVGCNRSHTAP